MNTKNRIMETAFKLFLEKGFDNVSLSEIKKESNITTGGFYHYFDSKDELLSEVIDKYLFDYFNRTLNQIKNCKRTPKERLKIVIMQMIGYDSSANEFVQLCETCGITDYRKFHLLYLGSLQNYDVIRKHYKELHLNLISFVKDLINEGKAQGEIRKDLDTNELSIFIQSVIDGTFLLWISVPELPLREAWNSNIDLAWNYMSINPETNI